MIKKSPFFGIFPLILTLMSLSCAPFNKGHKDYDVVLRVKPVTIRSLQAGDSIDAVEMRDGKIAPVTAVGVFKVESVLVGDWTQVRRGGPSKSEQMQQAIQDRNALKVLTMDFEDPDEKHLKELISVGVENPNQAFRVPEWEGLSSQTLRLYLKRQEGKPDSYYFVRAKI